MVGISFDPSYPLAAEMAKRLGEVYIAQFGERIGKEVQQLVAQGLLDGSGIRSVAAQLRETIGSTERQVQWLHRYERWLRDRSSFALRHPLRDRRADKAVTLAIDGKSLPEDRIIRLLSQMDERMTAVRADAIASEAMSMALGLAAYMKMLKTAKEAGIDPAKITKTWRSTRDNRSRWFENIMDGTSVPLLEPFTLPNGIKVRFPHDPVAPRSVRLSVRSVITFQIGR